MRGPWEYEEPACAEVGGDFWFPEKNEDSTELIFARRICALCTHKTECLEWALENERFGIWAGTNERTRQQMRARRSQSA